ncbi:PKD domain-containing protein [Pseudoflavitalea rhizosphaerae]|uniref:PKD domain-containing protein n=1 Tax=Pseudoflavitalea rhizosphaerae TaxID=1884793 RepID=UPI000F8D8922|nr:PKD domain-containing protein [Pseudoflavitalea rhizosphaerae]
MRNFLLCLLGILITMSAAAQHEPKGITAKNGEYIGFYQFLPPDYNKDTKTHPLIIFLHGAGEKGDGTTQLKNACWNGLPREIDEGSTMTFTWNGKTESFIVLTPQLNSKYGWWQNWYVDDLIDYATKNLRIDPNRIILTGLSMGGGGTWQYAGSSLENAKRLAAIGISCGACTNTTWSNMTNANLPIWAFHAEDDKSAAPVTCTKGAIQSLNALNPAVKPYMTIWPNGDHWIWTRVYNTKYEYNNPNIYEWFLAQNKSLPVNVRPVANAGGNQSITTGTAQVTLNAGASTDKDGKLLRFIWSKVSGPSFGTISTPVTTNGVTTVTNLTQAGTYVYEVKVVDDRCDWTTAQVTITVTDGPAGGNQNPVARAGNDITIKAPANSVTLNGSTSSDPDGSITAYNWTKVSGPTAGTIAAPNSSSTAVSGLTEGTYVFRLKVTDNKGATATDDITVTVNKADDKPTAWVVDAGADKTITLPTNSATLDGSNSSDPAGPLQQFEWTKISGPAKFTIANSKVQSTTVSNLAAGTYGFKFTAWNNSWQPKSDTVYITVKDAPVTSPDKPVVANAGADVTITLPTNSTTLNGSASVNPTGNVIKQYQWRKLTGPAQYSIANPKAAVTAVNNLAAGIYTFELMVWNHNWEPRADTVKVTVNQGSGGDPGTGDVVKANAGADITISTPASTATLNGSASSDPSGVIKEYKWRKISGPASFTIVNPAAPVTSVTGLTAGVYAFELMVWGHNWVPRADTVQVIVRSSTGNTGDAKAGLANAGPDIAITLPANSASLNGSASVDPLGQIKEYKWRKISGPAQFSIGNPAVVITPITNLVEGIYSFELMVWGKDWVPRADTVLVIVSSVAKTAVQSVNTETQLMAVATEVKETGASADKLKVYPNPAVSMINVETTSKESGNAQLKIYNSSGSLIRRISFRQQQSVQVQQVPVSDLKPGVYNVEILINNKTTLVSRFIKQ